MAGEKGITDEEIKAIQGIVMAVSAGRVRAQFNEVHARFTKKKKSPADERGKEPGRTMPFSQEGY